MFSKTYWFLDERNIFSAWRTKGKNQMIKILTNRTELITHGCIETSKYLSEEKKVKDKSRLGIWSLRGNFVWHSTGIHARPFTICVFLCDLFIIMNETDFTSYADDNTPYVTANSNIDCVILNYLKKILLNCSNALWITKWKLIVINVTFLQVARTKEFKKLGKQT